MTDPATPSDRPESGPPPASPSAPRDRRWRRQLAHTPLAALLAALAFLAWLFFVCNVREIFEFDSDDGNNVIKGLLLLEGHSFGDEIWSDQPPVFSFLLASVFATFGVTMEAARALVALFSASIVFGSYELLRRWSGHVSAIAGVVLLFISSRFVHLSLSVMIGLPSIAFALAGLFLLEEARRRSPEPFGWPLGRNLPAAACLAGSGALGALSLGTKLFTSPIVALTGVAAVGWGLLGPAQAARPLPTRLRSAALAGALYFAGLALGALVAFAPLLEAGTLSGLVDAHSRSRSRGTGLADGAKNLARFLTDDGVLFGVAILGAVVATLRRAFGPLLFVAWFLLCFLALYDHHPVWTHHRTLLTIPACLLAGYGLGEVLRLAEGSSPSAPGSLGAEPHDPSWPLGLTAVALLATLILFPDKDRREALLEPHGWSKNAEDWRIFKAFEVPARASRYVAAARPTHAFRAARPIPPNLAVTSSKRFVTGLLTPDQVAQDVEQFHPETILLTERWPGSVRARVRKAIAKTHLRVLRANYQKTELWVERALAAKLGLEESDSGRSRAKRESRRLRPGSQRVPLQGASPPEPAESEDALRRGARQPEPLDDSADGENSEEASEREQESERENESAEEQEQE